MVELEFDNDFNQRAEQLPTAIPHLAVGEDFNQPVEQLPPTSPHLAFDDGFLQSADGPTANKYHAPHI